MKFLFIIFVAAAVFAAPIVFAKVMLSMTKPLKAAEMRAMEELTAALLPRELARLHLDDLAKEAKKIEAEAERAAEREANIRKKLGVDKKLDELRETAKEAAVKKVLAKQEAETSGKALDAPAVGQPLPVVAIDQVAAPAPAAVEPAVVVSTTPPSPAFPEEILEEPIEGEHHDPSV